MGALVALLLLIMLQIGEGKSTFSTSYDASLDPLVWSRPFVQDTVRRHRTVSPQLNHHHYQQHHLHYHRHHHHHHHQKPCPELIKRRRQQSIKWLNTNYKKYLLRRRKLMLPTSC
ncbi:hypothetical protein ACLKA7_000544 [Drosophila subpalustris]